MEIKREHKELKQFLAKLKDDDFACMAEQLLSVAPKCIGYKGEYNDKDVTVSVCDAALDAADFNKQSSVYYNAKKPSGISVYISVKEKTIARFDILDGGVTVQRTILSGKESLEAKDIILKYLIEHFGTRYVEAYKKNVNSKFDWAQAELEKTAEMFSTLPYMLGSSTYTPQTLDMKKAYAQIEQQKSSAIEYIDDLTYSVLEENTNEL